MKFFYFALFSFAILAIEASPDRGRRNGTEHEHEHEHEHDSDEDCHGESGEHCRPEFIYKCNNIEYVNYLLDDAPAEDGVIFGEVSPGVPAFVGYGILGTLFGGGRIQITDPKGFYYDTADGIKISTDTAKIFYLKKNCDHNLTWVKASNGDADPFAIEPASPSANGVPTYFGRKSERERLSIVSTNYGALIANNEFGVFEFTSEYEILTCKSRVYEEPRTTTTTTTTPAPGSVSPPTGCIHQWKPYNGDNAPSVDGIAAGLYDNDNIAYVGKALQPLENIIKPARLQISQPNPGFYSNDRKNNSYTPNGFYLVNNPNYHYYWSDTSARPAYPNVVAIKFSETIATSRSINIGRIQVDGQTIVSYGGGFGFVYPGDDGTFHIGRNFQVLRCDPQPANICKQEWKHYNNDNAPATEGFKVDFYENGIVSYVGRSTNKYIQGKDYVIGRVQTAPSNESGVYTLQSVNGGEKFDTSFGEFLVKNPSDNYNWVNAHTGQEIDNALKVPLSPHNKCCGDKHHDHLFAYIGRFYLDNVVHVGTVYQSQGLAFVDVNGDKKVVSSFQVLTCASAEKYEETEESKECLDEEKFYFE